MPSEDALRQHRNVILIGVMGCGKTSVGWNLAKFLGFGFMDIDTIVEKQEGKSIARIFKDSGESRFRALESQVVKEVSGIKSHVIAVGGGTVMDDDNWQTLKSMGTTVWLRSNPQEIARRLAMDPGAVARRPLLADVAEQKDPSEQRRILSERVNALVLQRQSRYREASLIWDDSFQTAEVAAKALGASLRDGLA